MTQTKLPSRTRQGQSTRPGTSNPSKLKEEGTSSSPHLHIINFQNLPHIPLSKVLQCFHAGEYGDAELFAMLFKNRLIFDHTANKWYIWQGHYWTVDREDYISHCVSGHLASAYIQASADLNSQLKTNAPQADVEIDMLIALTEEEEKQGKQKDNVRALQGRAFALRSKRRAKPVLEYATAFLKTNADVWDTSPWLLGTENGVINLRTGYIQDGNPSDFIKTVSPTTWRGLDVPCPRFERYLDEVFSDRPEPARKELIEFLQRMLGYGITGKVNERLFMILYGENGHNGKDTLLHALKNTLGPVAGKVSNDVVIAPPKGHSSPGSAKPHLMALRGKRIAWASEPDKGARFDVGQVKELSGGDVPIVARDMYEKEQTFYPTFLLVLLTNHKPHADASDNAFWGRLCPIVYNLSYVDEPARDYERKKDTSLNEALDAEASGILAWLVRGCLKWQSAGVSIPQSVLLARKEYRKEEDTLGIFIEDMCNTTNGDYEVAASDLFAKYKDWLMENGMSLKGGLTGPGFGIEMKKRFKFKRMTKGILYQGIGLQSQYGVPPVNPTFDVPLHTTDCGMCNTRNWRLDASGKNECVTCAEAAAVQPQLVEVEKNIPSYPMPDRECYVCHTRNWYVAYTLGEASWNCATCNPSNGIAEEQPA